MKPFESVFILGGTSTIARAICVKLAESGVKKFHLVSRDKNSNIQFVKKLRSLYRVEVTQEEHDLLGNCSLSEPFLPKVDFYDLYLLTSGYLGDSDLAKVSTLEALKINAINYGGLIPWLTEITNYQRIKSKGSLWVFTSVASDRGRPSNYHYGAAKAALSIFCEGLLLRCHDKPFSVRIIKAGYIDTRMAENAPKILRISPKKVAEDLMHNPNKRGIEYLPWWWNVIMFFVRILPDKYAAKL